MHKTKMLLASSALALISSQATAYTQFLFDYSYQSRTTLNGHLSGGTGELDAYYYPDGRIFVYDASPTDTVVKYQPATLGPVFGTGELLIEDNGSAFLRLNSVVIQHFSLADDLYSLDWGQVMTGTVAGNGILGEFAGTGTEYCVYAEGIACVNNGLVDGKRSVVALSDDPQYIEFNKLAVGGTAFLSFDSVLLTHDGPLVTTTSLSISITNFEPPLCLADEWSCDYEDPDVSVLETPLPAAAWLFGSGLLGMLGLGVRKRGETDQGVNK